MEYKTVDEVYSANASIREKFKLAVTALSDDQLNAKPDGEAWSIAQIVEHVSMVNDGCLRICTKLLGKAEAAGRTNNGSIAISNEFIEAGSSAVGRKLQAPDIVQPVGGLPITDSIAKLDHVQTQFGELKQKFESVDGVEAKFPHPYFGDLSAQEWLVLSGAHEIRHLKQIRRVLEAIG